PAVCRHERVAHLVGCGCVETVAAELRATIAVHERADRRPHGVAAELAVRPGETRLEHAAPKRRELGSGLGDLGRSGLLREGRGGIDIEPRWPVAARTPTHGDGRPSARERSVAARTASRTAARKPCASSSARPAAVVPPGDVTAARNDSGDSSPTASRRLEPSSVWITSARALSRGRPTSTPASIIASARRNTYAGPEP